MLSRLVRAMDPSASMHMVVSMTGDGALGAELREAGIEVRGLGLTRGQVSIVPVPTLRRWVREWHADVLQTWMYHADLLGTVATIGLARPHLVWNLRAAHIDMERYRRLSGWTRALCARLSSRPALIIANSDAGVAAHRALGYAPRAWEVLPNGIDTSEYAPHPERRTIARRALGIPATATVVGVAARYDPMKGHDALAHVAASWLPCRPDVHVVVAGAGVDWAAPAYATLATANPAVVPRVHLLGQRSDVADVWNACDIGCSPSNSEGFSNAIVEAMACGLPVVVTDVGDSAHIVGDSTCVVPPAQPDALVACLGRLTDLPADERHAMGRRARQRVVDHFSLDQIATRYLDTYQRLSRP